MTSEVTAINGSHETGLDKDEKILKPRKSILTNDHDQSVQNGNNGNGSVSENGDSESVENGFDGEPQNGELNKPIKESKRSQRQRNLPEKRENTPNRQSLPREVKVLKESTPKPESPAKRELRQRDTTPQKSSPKPETQSKRELKAKGTPSKVNPSDNVESKSEVSAELSEQSVIVIEEHTTDETNVVGVTEKKEITTETPEEKGFFSAFRRISRRSSLELKDACEASSSSVNCIDSPACNEDEPVTVPTDIKGRKPINSFSRFPGRNVSITSVDRSMKRKAEESFGDEDRKRFAGETASGSEKSPGWSFFSPSRVWSPRQSSKTNVPTSTPFHKREEQDSMAVNYDSKTKLDLDVTMDSDTMSSQQKGNNKWCTIM